jgi:hypothetical protein
MCLRRNVSIFFRNASKYPRNCIKSQYHSIYCTSLSQACSYLALLIICYTFRQLRPAKCRHCCNLSMKLQVVSLFRVLGQLEAAEMGNTVHNLLKRNKKTVFVNSHFDERRFQLNTARPKCRKKRRMQVNTRHLDTHILLTNWSPAQQCRTVTFTTQRVKLSEVTTQRTSAQCHRAPHVRRHSPQQSVLSHAVIYSRFENKTSVE